MQITPDELVADAEQRTTPPPLPKNGIPKQKVPCWIRWPIRVIFLPFVLLDLAAQRFVKLFFKTPYKSVGGCKKRGNCCYYVIIPEPSSLMTKLNYFWHTEINGFYKRDCELVEIEGNKLVVLGCRYFNNDGSCSRYRLRPVVCREWPRIEYFGPPQRLKGCGFKAVPRDENFDPFPQNYTHPKKLNIID
jgi:Fe-S-cluster containining protein